MGSIDQELRQVHSVLSVVVASAEYPEAEKALDSLEHAAKAVGESWSGSWLGYHSRVYYENFATPPPGARFSQEWGFKECWPIEATVGEWQEFEHSSVIEYINRSGGNPDINIQANESKKARDIFDDCKSQILSLLSIVLSERPTDIFISDIKTQVEKVFMLDATMFAKAVSPKGNVMSRDIIALEKGFNTPPHIMILAKIASIRSPFKSCKELAKKTERILTHMRIQDKRTSRDARIGINVFIGHGQSAAWRDLKDFVNERLHLPWDEFNRVPIAGTTNIARLSQMLDDSAIAFLVMTAEDEQPDGKMHARMNVIHEAGLFQGRLGFTRAIVVLEDGCEEFSNIQGLGQIRFPKGNIQAAFEQVRQVLEREGLIE